MPGQITLDTEFGKRLRDLARDPRYKIFIESGTWDGEGSTKCIVEGLKSRSPEDASGAVLLSLEANKDLWMVARRYWQDRSAPLQLLWGRMGERMWAEEKIRAHPLFDKIKEHFDLYFQSDVQHFLKAPRIHFRRCDVWMADGGEFSTEGEWDAIRKLKPKVVCLDDINVMKNADLFKLLLFTTGWLPLFISPERNGCAILECPNPTDEKFYPAWPRWQPADISGNLTPAAE